MENHENQASRAIARIKDQDSCTGMTMQLHGTL
jgi:hypothetical protein